jgi:hypothetical protein
MCFQRSREERAGGFGAPAAHNSVKNLVKFCSRSWPWRSRSHIEIFAPLSAFWCDSYGTHDCFQARGMQRYEWAFTFRYQPGEGDKL